jgi:hypothetical protein
MQPTPGDVHVNVPLTQISIAYMQDLKDFVADKVFPNVPVQKQSDIYLTYPKGQWFRTEAKPRGMATESAGSGFDIDTTNTYNCKIQSFHKDIDDQLRSNADAWINLDISSAEFVTRSLLLRKELDFMTSYFSTGNKWTGSTTGLDLVANPLWSTTSTPITDIRTQIKSIKMKTGFRPNTLVLSESVWTKLQDNADFINRIAVTQLRVMTTDLLARVLGIDNVFIAGAVVNTATELKAVSMAYAAGDYALLCYRPDRPSIMTPSAGYTFSWVDYLGASEQGMRIKRLRADLINSDRIEGDMAYDLKLIAPELGAFWATCIA